MNRDSYVKYIERVIYGNLAQAQLGGVPGTLNIVRSFLNVRPSTKNQEIIEVDTLALPPRPPLTLFEIGTCGRVSQPLVRATYILLLIH